MPSFNDNRVVGLETEQGVIWFRLCKGPLHKVAGQYFKCAPASRKPTHALRRARADLSARPRAAQAAAARRRRPPLSGAGHVRPPLTECATEPLAASIRKQIPPSRGARAQQGPSASLSPARTLWFHLLSRPTSAGGGRHAPVRGVCRYRAMITTWLQLSARVEDGSCRPLCRGRVPRVAAGSDLRRVELLSSLAA